ncbi:MAG: hypothetical protein ABIY70_26330 [Capsulimonas sp.]|uniref:hypothetical protein n=1 Tax=Capsulimonas sp. TaxID=2494211 RepID=UPI003267E3ED
MSESPPEQKTIEEQVSALAARLDHVQQVSTLNSKIAKLKFYRDEDAREWALLSNRVNAYVTSQSFLVSATVLALANSTPHGHLFRLVFPLILGAIGLATSVLAYQGVTSAMDVIRLWRDKCAALSSADSHEDALDDYYVVRGRPYNWLRAINQNLFARFQRQIVDPQIDEIHVRSLKFALLTPWIFGTAWVVFGVLEVYFYFLTGSRRT